jgi:hypothetical protein
VTSRSVTPGPCKRAQFYLEWLIKKCGLNTFKLLGEKLETVWVVRLAVGGHIERDGLQQWWMVSALHCAASSHSTRSRCGSGCRDGVQGGRVLRRYNRHSGGDVRNVGPGQTSLKNQSPQSCIPRSCTHQLIPCPCKHPRARHSMWFTWQHRIAYKRLCLDATDRSSLRVLCLAVATMMCTRTPSCWPQCHTQCLHAMC